MKATGVILIIVSGLCLGLNSAAALHRREAALLDFKQMLQAFKSGIGCTAMPLSQLIAQTESSRFCVLAQAQPTICTNPKQALLTSGAQILRNKDDLKLYTGFVQNLGETDTQSQLEHIELYSQLLQANLTAAANERASKSRLYVYIGLFGGIALSLVLL